MILQLVVRFRRRAVLGRKKPMVIKTVITAGYALKAGFNLCILYGGVERCPIEGFRINSVGYLSTSGQTDGFVVRSKDTPPLSFTEIVDTTGVICSRVRQIYINTDSISRMMQHS